MRVPAVAVWGSAYDWEVSKYVLDHFLNLVNFSMFHYLPSPQISQKSTDNFLIYWYSAKRQTDEHGTSPTSTCDGGKEG